MESEFWEFWVLGVWINRARSDGVGRFWFVVKKTEDFFWRIGLSDVDPWLTPPCPGDTTCDAFERKRRQNWVLLEVR